MSFVHAMGLSRFWQVAAICMVAVMLGGCVTTGMGATEKFDQSSPQGVIVVGYGSFNFGTAKFVRFDPQTRQPEQAFYRNASGDLSLKVATSGWEYKVFVVEPGHYALAVLDTTTAATVGGAYQTHRRLNLGVDENTGRLLDATPTFHVQAGEIVYIGSLTLDFLRRGGQIYASDFSSRAREVLDGYPNVRGEMVTRLITAPPPPFLVR